MPIWIWTAIALVIIGVSVVLFIILERRSGQSSDRATPAVSEMGYGKEKWTREYALWSGILRRLEIQAQYQSPVSERLQSEMEAARAKVTEAEKYIKKG